MVVLTLPDLPMLVLKQTFIPPLQTVKTEVWRRRLSKGKPEKEGYTQKKKKHEITIDQRHYSFRESTNRS